jgi:predicted membrane-bound mannosyltransferase
VVFALVFVIFFGQFGTHLSGVWDGAYGGLRYWAHEHSLHRGGEDWFAYLILLVGYELPLVVLGAIGAVWSLRTRHALGGGLVVATVLTLSIYSYAGERFAWLLVTTLLPLALLAGLGFAALWRSSRAATIAVVLPLAAVLAWSNVQVQVLHPNDPDELMTVAPTSAAVPRIAADVRERDASARAAGRTRPTIEVDPNYGSGSPWSWYLRGLHAGYPDMSKDTYVPRGDVLIVADVSHDLLAPRLDDYAGHSFILRGRRPPLGTGFSVSGFVRWFVHRTAWGPQSPERSWLYVRRADVRSGAD